MKYCQHCGKELADDSVYCPECGGFNGEPGQQVYQSGQQANTNNTTDKDSAGFNVLSFFFPIVGLILYLVWKEQYPIKAKGCGKWALIGFIVNMILSICSITINITGA